MIAEDQRLAQGLSIAAEDLGSRGYSRAGLLRQAARRLVELSVAVDRLHPDHEVDTTVDGCAYCGRRIVQKGRGRPRKFCDDDCKAAARKPEMVD